ncbi:MAG TPA: DUF4397 domain-containing protein [Candidatus Kapabacteria bacterium]|nr:DUF4397 domain-containing protein [Candidatus Kapabacteria bacterium]
MAIKTGKSVTSQLTNGLFLFGILLSVSAAAFFSSCTPVCDYPSTRFAQIRPVNAMSDQDNITIWLNGKVFKKSYSYDPPDDFGYYATFADDSPLTTGTMMVTITADEAGKDTLIADTAITFDLHKQSLIIIGRAHTLPGEPNSKKIILLNDEVQSQDNNFTLVRFVHAIPDLPALDIFWTPDSIVDATARYGVPTEYFMITNLKQLHITEAGNPANVIVDFNSPTAFNGFVITALIRGRTQPIDHERQASALFLSDVTFSYINNLQTFGIRLMNASRNRPKLSVGIQAASFGDTIRFNYPRQDVTLLDIPNGTLTGYLFLRPEYNGNTIAQNKTTYFFCTDHVARPAFPDSLDHFSQTANPDERYTFVAVDTIPLSKHIDGKLDHLIIRDTLAPSTDPLINRVRIIHVNPDHTSTLVTIGATARNMGFKGVTVLDVPVGQTNLELKDGTAIKTIPITVGSGRPISIYILPDTDSETFPVKIFTE